MSSDPKNIRKKAKMKARFLMREPVVMKCLQ